VRGREDVILAGSIILFHLMQQFGINKIKVSTKGIRYGKIVDELFS
jgi:exopolyphosphatase/pppGpp-phosphohydrolase